MTGTTMHFAPAPRGFKGTGKNRNAGGLTAVGRVGGGRGGGGGGESAKPAAPSSTAAVAEAPVAEVGEVIGRVLLRGTEGRGQGAAKPGARIEPGAAVVTGRGARVELRVPGEGLWRVGALAVWQAESGGFRLLSGSALAAVPAGGAWRVDSLGGRLWLGEGVWMLTAVRNEGLKIVCLDAHGELRAGLADVEGKEKTDTRRLRAGELVFLRPAGKGFGPVLTVFLEELLETSRLVKGFAAPLPRLERLEVVAAAQRERLQGVTNALVAGASDDRGFEVVVPGGRPGGPETKKDAKK